MSTVTKSSGCGCSTGVRSVGALVPMPKTSGCGCGGSCGGSGCSCGTTGTSLGATGTPGFMRPHFFPGQLLTEDDLGGLVDYVTAKQKLHNRMLFGDGVACGLEVDCDPCGGGKVTVGAGYALDCCGNDIVVPCPTRVDVIAMVQQLQRELGADCGQVCPPRTGKCPPALDGNYDDSNSRELLASANNPRVPVKTGPAPDLTRTYCLYVRYHEDQVEPVAPYTTGDSCGDAACQYARVKEGYSFELRCLADHPQAPNMLQSFIDCIGGLAKSDAPMDLLAGLGERHERYQAAFTALGGAQKGTTWDENILKDPANEAPFEKVLRYEKATAMWMSSRLYPQQYGPQSNTSTDDFRHQLSSDIAAMRTSNLTMATPFQTNLAYGILKFLVDTLQVDTDAVNDQTPFELRFLAAGASLDAQIYGQLAPAISELRQKLYTAASAGTADCTLLKAIAAVVVPPAVGSAVSQADAQQLDDSLDALVKVLVRFAKDCACRAVLVKCAPCDDPAVLLACMDIDGCEVTSICNLVRRFVLSPAAVRYWAGTVFDFASDLLEAFCCGTCPDPKTAIEPRQANFEERVGVLTSFAALKGSFNDVATMVAIRAQQPGLHGLTGMAAAAAAESAGLKIPKLALNLNRNDVALNAAAAQPQPAQPAQPVRREVAPQPRPRPRPPRRGGGGGGTNNG